MIKIDVDTVREVIREAMGALRMLDYITLEVVIHGSSRDVKLEEIITDIRVIKGVATVSQDSIIKRSPTGRRVVNLIVSFDSKGTDSTEYIDMMAQEMKKNKFIDRIILKKLNDHPIRDDQGRRIVY